MRKIWNAILELKGRGSWLMFFVALIFGCAIALYLGYALFWALPVWVWGVVT